MIEATSTMPSNGAFEAASSAEQTEAERRLLAAIASRGDRLIALLRELVAFDTSNPPGLEAEAQAWIAEKLRAAGMTVDRWDALPGRPNVVGTLKGRPDGNGRSLILAGHVDVADVRDPAQWQRNPFGGDVVDGMLYGRGSSDMKSALATYLLVVETLRECGIRLEGDLAVASAIGEERGEPGTRAIVERGYRSDFAIVGEATSCSAILASVGVLGCRITIKSPYTLHLHARRLAMHAGGGVEGANAIEKMAMCILPALNDLERHWAVFKRHPAIPPAQALINCFDIKASGGLFFLPEECTMDVVVLYLPGEKAEEVKAQVEDHVNRAAQSDLWLRKYPPRINWDIPEFPASFIPADLDGESEPVRELARAATVIRGQAPQVGQMRGAITDAGQFAAVGIPAVVFGPGDAQWIHRTDERVPVKDVLDYACILAVFIGRWCRTADS